MGRWSYSSFFLDLTTRFTVGKEPRSPLDMRLSGPQSRSVRCAVEENLRPARRSFATWRNRSFRIFVWAAALNFVSRDSSVGIVTGYGLDDQRGGSSSPVGSKIFTSPYRSDRLWGPPNRGLFPGGKAAEA
jgi:hypothetical protein